MRFSLEHSSCAMLRKQIVVIGVVLVCILSAVHPGMASVQGASTDAKNEQVSLPSADDAGVSSKERKLAADRRTKTARGMLTLQVEM